MLPNLTIFVLKAQELDPGLIFSIIWIKLLLKFPFELVPCINGIGSSPSVVMLATLPNKCSILREESSIAHLLSVIVDVISSN